MASFTDQIMQFNPYVKQLPTEAMAQVGMYKQQKYEEGVQKIQSEIDRIAGLDVVKPLHKQYLQSKLDELGGKLRNVAASDFSNFQVVNSVGGMASQIGRDAIVQNAVASTARYRKGISEMDAARKEGKSSPSNEFIFKRSASEWLDDKDINKQFSGEYKPYSNWKKESVELLKALTKDSTITEDIFTPDGRLSDHTLRTKFAGISPEKIQQALLVGLTPSAMEQMQMDGIYTYANKTPEEFKLNVFNDFRERVDYFTKQRSALENAKLNTTSGLEKQKIDSQIASLNKMINNVTSEYQGIANSLENGNTDSAKASLYTANQITNFAKAFSFTETEQTYGQNYAAEMALKRELANKEWQKFILTYEQTEKWKIKEYDQAERKIKAETTPIFGGLPQPVNQDDLPKFTLSQITEQVNKVKSEISTSDATLAKTYNKDKSKTDAQWMAEQRDKWQQGKADPVIADYFNRTEDRRRFADLDQQMVLDIEKEAKNKKYIVDGKELSSVDLSTLIPAGTKGLSFNTGRGTYSFTPEEIVEFNAKKSRYISSTTPGPGVMPTVVVNYDGAKKGLSDKEYALFSIFAKQGARSSADNQIIGKIQEIGSLTGANYNKLISAQGDYIANEVTKRVTNMQGVKYDFNIGKQEFKSAVAGALTDFADLADTQKGKLPYSPEFNSEDLRKISSDLVSASMTVVEGTSYVPAMYEITATGKDGKTTKFRVTPEQKVAKFGDLFEASPEERAFNRYLEMINRTGTKSTSFTEGPSTWADSQLGKLDFSNVASFGVKGDIHQVGTDGYSIRLNIRDPRTGQITEDIAWPKKSLATKKEVLRYMAQVNDITAFELLYNRSPNAAEIKQIQNAQNKPF